MSSASHNSADEICIWLLNKLRPLWENFILTKQILGTTINTSKLIGAIDDRSFRCSLITLNQRPMDSRLCANHMTKQQTKALQNIVQASSQSRTLQVGRSGLSVRVLACECTHTHTYRSTPKCTHQCTFNQDNFREYSHSGFVMLCFVWLFLENILAIYVVCCFWFVLHQGWYRQVV